jgi:hypothetical protein
MSVDLNSVPVAAMRFTEGHRFQFADSSGETGLFPFRMLARSLEPVNHYYWGRIVHDMSGMITRKNSVTVDYAHDFDAVIGFADQFAVTDSGLEVAGSLVSIETGDKADEVFRKGKAGVPYEASIDWVGPETELEYIPEGVNTDVNGRQFSGPGYVVRKWPLRAIAVCRYGVDADTNTQFSDKGGKANVAVRLFSSNAKEETMATGTTPTAETKPDSEKAPETKPVETPATETAPAAPEAQQFSKGMISIDTVKQFSAEFGAKAPEYLSQGLSLDAARYQFAIHERDAAKAEAKQFADQATAEKKRADELATKLKQFGHSLGQETPVESGGDGKGGEVDPKLKQFGDDPRAKFAAAVKLPTSRK